MSEIIFEYTDESDDRVRVVSRSDSNTYMVSVKHPDEAMSHLVEVSRSAMQDLIAALQKDLRLAEHSIAYQRGTGDPIQYCTWHRTDGIGCKQVATRALRMSSLMTLNTIPNPSTYGMWLCEYHAERAGEHLHHHSNR